MGTRADFYVGRGENAEWLGSIAFDGYRIHEVKEGDGGKNDDLAACVQIKLADNEASFRAGVEKLLSLNDTATTPAQGWPWPWETSSTTDYAYAFDGQTWVSVFGHAWFDAKLPRPENDSEQPKSAVFPDMTKRKNVTLGPRSGLIVIGGPR